MLVIAGYRFTDSITKLTKSQVYFIQLVEELKSGQRKLGQKDETMSDGEKVVPAHQFGLEFLRYRQQARKEHARIMKAKVDADLAAFSVVVQQKESKYKPRESIAVMPKPKIPIGIPSRRKK